MALTCTAKGDGLFEEQILGSSDWPDFEGDAAFTVPPKQMAELYASQADQVGHSDSRHDGTVGSKVVPTLDRSARALQFLSFTPPLLRAVVLGTLIYFSRDWGTAS